jgi:hypothetical protein
MKSNIYIPPHKRVQAVDKNSQPHLTNDLANRVSTNSDQKSNTGVRPWHKGVDKTQLTDSKNTSNNFSHKPDIPKSGQSNNNKFKGAKIPLKYTEHAFCRMEQRDISKKTIAKVWHNGEKSDQGKGFATHRDEDTLLVLRQNKQVVTVMENKRNTKYDLLRQTKIREKDLIKKATYQNNDSAMCDLAELYLSGSLGPTDVQKAHDWLIKAANKNNSHAMCKLSQLHESGALGAKNLTAAREWMEKAAKFGNSYALAISGQRYLAEYQMMCRAPFEISDQEKAEVRAKAINFLERAANKGATRAIWQLGEIYEKGLLGEKDLSKAIKFYSKAAKSGSPSSLTSLNDLVLKGEFDSGEFEAILEQASKLVARTSSQLAIDIGLQQIQGDLGHNQQRGLNMIEQAAQKGNKDALVVLVKCYRGEYGCKPNQERCGYWALKLKELYEKAAAGGNIDAMWGLGELFLKGTLGTIDLEQAEQAFIQAAREGDIDAIYSLGMLYIKGRLGNKSPSDGIVWIEKAIEMWSTQSLAGDNEAALFIGGIYLDGDLGSKDYQKAVQWLSLAAHKGHIDSMIPLAELYLSPKSGYKNIEIALSWLEKILNHGDVLSSLEDLLDLFGILRLKENIHESFPWFLEKALDNNTLEGLANQQSPYTFIQKRSMSQVAQIYRTGDLGSPDYVQAAKWYSVLAAKGSVAALMALARMFQSKCLSETDNSEKALVQKLITGLSKQKVNHAKDALMIGKFYKEGGLLVKNLHEAVKWYYLATQLSESDKEYFEINKEFEALLNFKDYNSEEKPQIIQGAINLADEKSKPPQMKVISRVLGDIYNAGILTEHNPLEAIRWYEKSAKLSNFKAMYGLGSIYEAGVSESTDLAKAIEWYIQSAQGDNQDAIKRLTTLCNLSDLDPVLKSKIEAWQIEHLSNMEKDNSPLPDKNSGILAFYPKEPNAMYELGKQYLDQGCKEQDCLQAAHWFRKAAKKNHPEAAFELAKMYESGMLGEQTRPVSIGFYKQALKCYKLMLEEQSPYNCDISDNIGIIYSKLGKTEKSLAYQEKAFKIRQGLEINDHQNPIESLVPDYISELPSADKITCQVQTNLLGGVGELS